ncbi:uncharacterized protein LOC124386623 isoform X2 [Silurus meridionalis]|uniref:uncharacterized protein LOC124386623 isoform X2 n=1 Tax=Silurus meridionalis TaxID=175797 RepID=UPI001EEA982C|nr:uncharacterized protein LOC124386623 isoform X2 [Silurus meridionalis]
MSNMEKHLFNLKFAAKELDCNAKKCYKEEKAEKAKVKKVTMEGVVKSMDAKKSMNLQMGCSEHGAAFRTDWFCWHQFNFSMHKMSSLSDWPDYVTKSSHVNVYLHGEGDVRSIRDYLSNSLIKSIETDLCIYSKHTLVPHDGTIEKEHAYYTR